VPRINRARPVVGDFQQYFNSAAIYDCWCLRLIFVTDSCAHYISTLWVKKDH